MPSKDIKIGGAGLLTAKPNGRDIGEVYSNLVMCMANLGNVYSATCFTPITFIFLIIIHQAHHLLIFVLVLLMLLTWKHTDTLMFSQEKILLIKVFH